MKYQPHAAGVGLAEGLIAEGCVNLSDEWSFDDNDRQAILGAPNDWPRFAAFHLGRQADALKNFFSVWAYPIGKHGMVYRSAIRSAQVQSLKNGDAKVARAAGKLLSKINVALNPDRRSWYEMKVTDDSGEIFIFDEIGFLGITAKDFVNDFQALKDKKNLTLHINSPGGMVFDGLAIFNLLNRVDAHITTVIDGIAASIASVIAMAGDEIVMPENAFMMIHNPMGGAWGYAEDLRSVADTLDKMKMSVMTAYRRSGLEDDAINSIMDAETWLTARESVDLGFADKIEKPVKIAASFNLSKFRYVPAQLTAEHDAEGVGTGADVKKDPVSVKAPMGISTVGEAIRVVIHPDESVAKVASDKPIRALNDHAAIAAAYTEAGFPYLIASAIEDGQTMDHAVARIAEVKAIVSICKLAKLPDEADSYIKAGLTKDQARTRLFELMVFKDRASAIDSSLPIDTTSISVPQPSKYREMWDRAIQDARGIKQ